MSGPHAEGSNDAGWPVTKKTPGCSYVHSVHTRGNLKFEICNFTHVFTVYIQQYEVHAVGLLRGPSTERETYAYIVVCVCTRRTLRNEKDFRTVWQRLILNRRALLMLFVCLFLWYNSVQYGVCTLCTAAVGAMIHIIHTPAMPAGNTPLQ